MSWSASTSKVAAKDAVAKLRESFRANCPTPSTEEKEQFAKAATAAVERVKTTQPDGNGLVNISANGHHGSPEPFTLSVSKV